MFISAVLALLMAQAPDLAALSALPTEPEPASITRGQHYWIGNEDRLDLFYNDIVDLGGMHIGVGAEQNWLLCGWSRCEVLLLMDCDQAVVDLHNAYIATFAETPTREGFLELWRDRTRKASRAAVITRYDGRQALGALKAVDVGRWSIERRFARLITQLSTRQLPSFLTDDAQYAHLHELAAASRVFAVRGDLTAKKTVIAIGAAAIAAPIEVRTLYLSNAEQYFKYNKQTRKNLLSLPIGGRSVVMRTHGDNDMGYAADDAADGHNYHYGVQTGESFRAFIADSSVTSSRQILHWSTPLLEAGASKQTSTSPRDAKAAWETTKKTAKAKKATASTKQQSTTP